MTLTSKLTRAYWIDALLSWAEARLAPPQYDECKRVLDELQAEPLDIRAAVEAERDVARKERGEMTFARNVALTLANNMVDERDAARADASRLAIVLNMAYDAMMEHDFGTITIAPFAKSALAAHTAAIGKSVTP